MLHSRRQVLVVMSVIAIVVGLAPLRASAQWTVVNLHPAGAIESRSFGAYQSQQVGEADIGGSRASQWFGAPSTLTDLHAGGTSSNLLDTFDGNHVGAVQIGGIGHASLWSGSPVTWVDLHPAGATFSGAEGVGGHTLMPGIIRQVGGATVGGVHRASMWFSTAASWVDLHPPVASFSIAYNVDDDEQVGMAIVSGTALASLWNGTSASWISLHPAGGVTSSATGVHAGQQVGFVDVGGSVFHASLWSGTGASWVDLHPAAGLSSQAHNIMAGRQVGEVRVGGIAHASVWSGTAASWEDLHPILGPQYTGGSSAAYGIWVDGTTTYVAGYAFNTALSRYEAILWVETTPLTNDSCASPESLSDGANIFSNVGASTDGPAEPSCLPIGFNGIDDNDVWYEYIAGCDGFVNFEVHPGSFDTLAGVYSGSCGGLLLDCGMTSLGGAAYLAILPSIAGETFTIRLGGLPGAQGGVGSIIAQCIPSVGACCDPIGVCMQVSPSTCQSGGGTYYGDGTTCGPLSCPPPAPQINFASPSAVGTGSDPIAVVAGDFDQDGDNDLAVCDLSSQTLTVLRNDGSGMFQFDYAVSVGNVSQQDVVAADLDADGDIDLAIAAEAVVLERNVNGVLGAWNTHSVGSSDVRAIIAADFDGDCTIDLATANSNPPGNDVAVLLNVNGDFSQPILTQYSVGTNPVDLVAADVDRDGFADIVAVNTSSTDITVLYNNGAGNFSTSVSFMTGLGCCPSAIATGDLDGDLFPDVVVTNLNSNQISVMLNDGMGGFLTPTILSVGSFPRDVAMADLDGDEDQDVLLVYTNNPYQIAVLTNDGSGGFYTPLTFNVGTSPQNFAVAHLNTSQDGALDVAVPISGSDELMVLLNIGDQDCNANGLDDDTEPSSALNFVMTGTSNATPCSFRAFGTGFDVQGEFCVTSGSGSGAFAEDVIARLNEAGCPGIRAQRINGLPNGFTVRAPGNTLDFCIGSAPGPATCCFSSSSVCSCNPDVEEFFFSSTDCNANGLDDAIDLYVGTSKDIGGNGIPDECEVEVPTMSQWSLVVMTLLLLIGGTAVIRKTENAHNRS